MTLKELRELRGLSRKQVAALSGINLRSLQDYEQGHKDITRARSEIVYRLSVALGCTMEEILTPYMISAADGAAGGKISLSQREIEACSIYSKNYGVYGKWKIQNEVCNLVFLYQGDLVTLPFEAVFSEEKLPWLVQAAIMMIEDYIGSKFFESLCDQYGGEEWDEW